MDKYQFEPSRIFNVDSSITTVPNKVPKVLAFKGKRQVGIVTSAERGTPITAAICCNVAGYFLPPLMIFTRVRHNPVLEMAVQLKHCLFVTNPAGCNLKFSPQWFTHFLKYTKPSKEIPVHTLNFRWISTYKNLNFITRAKENNVHILCIRSYTSR